jgi:hypothetical protein
MHPFKQYGKIEIEKVNIKQIICIIHKAVHQNVVSLCNHDDYVTRNSLVNNADVSWFPARSDYL